MKVTGWQAHTVRGFVSILGSKAVGTGTILLAEDDPAVRTLTKLVLESSGYSVLVARNGREAVDIFQRRASEIALVLLDMTMPVMGGKEAFRLIRKIRPDVPVIILTGYRVDRRMFGCLPLNNSALVSGDPGGPVNYRVRKL